eukprot:131035-Pleurochrysis_carterae.AAC.2
MRGRGAGPRAYTGTLPALWPPYRGQAPSRQHSRRQHCMCRDLRPWAGVFSFPLSLLSKHI